MQESYIEYTREWAFILKEMLPNKFSTTISKQYAVK